MNLITSAQRQKLLENGRAQRTALDQKVDAIDFEPVARILTPDNAAWLLAELDANGYLVFGKYVIIAAATSVVQNAFPNLTASALTFALNADSSDSEFVFPGDSLTGSDAAAVSSLLYSELCTEETQEELRASERKNGRARGSFIRGIKCGSNVIDLRTAPSRAAIFARGLLLDRTGGKHGS